MCIEQYLDPIIGEKAGSLIPSEKPANHGDSDFLLDPIR